jgi:outer membrane murein-binding lipoprotein Lpp
MLRHTMRLMTGGAVVALALMLTGCGSDNTKSDPKVDSNAPKLTPQGAGGGPGKTSTKAKGAAE